MPTLRITVGEHDRLDDRTRRRIAAARDGEDPEAAQPVLNFESYDDLHRLLSPTNLELLEAVATHEPDSVRATADLVGRDYKGVHRNLHELAELGVIEFEGGGSGVAKRPLLAYDGLEISVPFGDRDPGLDLAAP